MNANSISSGLLRRRFASIFSGSVFTLAGLVVFVSADGLAQDGFGSSAGRSQPTIPPVPLERGYPQSTTVVPGPMTPMSIAPAPGFSPTPAFSPYAVPLYGPPAFGQPVFGAPVYFAPPVAVAPWPATSSPIAAQPSVPFATNFAPASPFLEQRRVENSAVPVRSSNPANLEITVSEAFLNRILARESVEPGPVRDFVMGAKVTGKQTTVSKLNVDMVSSSTKARIALVLTGDVQTLTTGMTPQAMIDTAGQQQFVAVKDVFFDGWQFSTRHATVFVRARNQTLGATTPLSGSLFGGLADRIAFRAAERRKSEGEAVARERTAERLYPRFDGDVDDQLANANRQLDQVVRRHLELAKLMPSTQAVWTTDSRLFHTVLVGREPATANIAPPREALVTDAGITISIHESLLNSLVDRTGLKGFKTTDRKLRELQDRLLPSANDNSRSDDSRSGSLKLPRLPSEAEGIETEIVFDDHEPLTFKLETDRLIATVKATFKPAGQNVVPPMIVSIPFRAEIKGEKIRWVADSPSVSAQDRTNSKASLAVVEMMIQKMIEAEFTPLEFDRALPSVYWPVGGQPPRVTSIKSADGWVGISID
jgi:hypothetical protein